MKIFFVAFIELIALYIAKRDRLIAKIFFLIWLIVIVYIVFLNRSKFDSPQIIVVPFRSMRLFFRYFSSNPKIGLDYVEGAILNIMLFIPFGYLISILFSNIDHWWKAVLCGILISLIIEIAQLLSCVGVFDFEDIINNTLGTIVGWCCTIGLKNE